MAKVTKTPADYTLTIELNRAEAENLMAVIRNSDTALHYGLFLDLENKIR